MTQRSSAAPALYWQVPVEHEKDGKSHWLLVAQLVLHCVVVHEYGEQGVVPPGTQVPPPLHNDGSCCVTESEQEPTTHTVEFE